MEEEWHIKIYVFKFIDIPSYVTVLSCIHFFKYGFILLKFLFCFILFKLVENKIKHPSLDICRKCVSLMKMKNYCAILFIDYI